MKPEFGTVTIVGVGLLGGSLGLGLKQQGYCSRVRGVGRRQESLDTALEVGAIDEAFLDPAQGCCGADLVVLCTPAALVPKMLDTIRPACSETTVVTDVASTKGAICRHARDTWPKPLRFVGSHPMAGSEKFGPENAVPDLYHGAVTFVADQEENDKDAARLVWSLWHCLGSMPVRVKPDEHDELVARTSHIPHVAAACLALLAGQCAGVRPFVGTGFRDTTRIAAGRPEVWRDICRTNTKAIVEGLDELAAILSDARDRIASGDEEALMDFFRSGNEARNKALGE